MISNCTLTLTARIERYLRMVKRIIVIQNLKETNISAFFAFKATNLHVKADINKIYLTQKIRQNYFGHTVQF